jgi:hypothetical protein
MAFRRLGAAALALAITAGAARAESPEPPDPVYHNLRYEDDACQAKAQAAPDLFAPIKCVGLGDGPAGRSYLTLGGEARERFETYGHINFGFNKAPARDAYELQRLLLNADLHVTDYFRAFAQLGHMERFGERGVPSTTDVDRGEIMQAFVDLKAPGPFGDRPTLRLGREELLFGWQRLIAVREGPNVRRAFDGVRVSDRIGDVAVDAFAVRPVVNNPGTFDDVANTAQRLSGVYLTAPVPFLPALKADLYGLDYERDAAKFRGLTGDERRTTWGARLFGAARGFDWNFEGDYQTGSFRNLDIRAYWLAASTGYKLESLAWTPRLGLQANLASGDKGGATLGTFNAMFPRLPYFAEISMLVPANVRDLRPTLTFNPVKSVQVVLGYDMLWRASTADGLYGSGEALFAGTSAKSVTGARIGEESSFDIRWRVDPHLSVGAIAAHMTAGPALAEAGGKPVDFGVLYMKYKF